MRRLEVKIEPTTGRAAHYYQWICDHCGYRDKPEPA